jgi:hypothetical protein
MLRQLANVFMVQPATLKSVMNESYLSRIDDRLLRPYLMMRSDWNDIKKMEEFSSVAGAEELEKKGGMERVRGLMSELENFKGLSEYYGNYKEGIQKRIGSLGGGHGNSLEERAQVLRSGSLDVPGRKE